MTSKGSDLKGPRIVPGPKRARVGDTPWADRRLAVVLPHFYEAYRLRNTAQEGLSNFDAALIAAKAQASERTVRRWVQKGLPRLLRDDVERVMLPAPELLAQEAKELEYAREALARLRVPRARLNTSWVRDGWLGPHVVSIAWTRRLQVCIPRLGRHDPAAFDRMSAGAVLVDQVVLPNRFEAQVVKGELLKYVNDWRIVLPADLVSRGRTEAWLEMAPRPALKVLAKKALAD